MTKILNLDEMLDILGGLDAELASDMSSQLETIGTRMAEAIGSTLGVEWRPASAEGPAFGGTCAGFKPAFDGQECPEPLTHYDEEADWE